jgi:hypothetical protein
VIPVDTTGTDSEVRIRFLFSEEGLSSRGTSSARGKGAYQIRILSVEG